MLDEYQQKQKIVYRILKNTIEYDRLSHAYLFETKGNDEAYQIALSFAKYILCPFNYRNNSKCVACGQCNKIDKNIFSELKIIEPDGLWIKKEQLENLQKEFSYTSVEANKKVYIIKQADRLNPSAANSILKFLEEPEPNIIAILLVDNLYQVMDTIFSRCQIINFSKPKKENELNYLEKINNLIKVPYLENEEVEEKINCIIKFVNNIETKKLDSLIYTKKFFHDIFKEKNEILFAFDIMILYYKDLIYQKINRKKQIFKDIDNTNILNINTLEKLNRKLLEVINIKERINYNANANLLVDKLIIELVGGDEYETNSWDNI